VSKRRFGNKHIENVNYVEWMVLCDLVVPFAACDVEAGMLNKTVAVIYAAR
jgi:hypothetical protein